MRYEEAARGALEHDEFSKWHLTTGTSTHCSEQRESSRNGTPSTNSPLARTIPKARAVDGWTQEIGRRLALALAIRALHSIMPYSLESLQRHRPSVALGQHPAPGSCSSRTICQGYLQRVCLFSSQTFFLFLPLLYDIPRETILCGPPKGGNCDRHPPI
jgi:hypothetical protein